MKKDSKITSVKSDDVLASSLKRSRTLSELDVSHQDLSPLSQKLAQSNTFLDSLQKVRAERPLTLEEINTEINTQLVLDLNARIHLLEGLLKKKRDLDKKPYVSGIKKILGIVKKDGKNRGKLFSCLRGADEKTVAKTFKILDEPLESLAYLKDGVKRVGDKAKHWSAWFAKENDEMVLGSYSEVIDDLAEMLHSGEVDEC